MGFLSKIKKAVGRAVASAPGGSQLQKIIAKDPIAQTVMKYDPATKELAGAVGLIAPQAAAAAPSATPMIDDGRKTTMPVRQPSWQDERVAALRARFGRTKPAAPVAQAAPVGAMPAPVTAAPPQPAAQVTLAAKPAVVNPVAQDVDAYSRAWNGNQIV